MMDGVRMGRVNTLGNRPWHTRAVMCELRAMLILEYHTSTSRGGQGRNTSLQSRSVLCEGFLLLIFGLCLMGPGRLPLSAGAIQAGTHTGIIHKYHTLQLPAVVVVAAHTLSYIFKFATHTSGLSTAYRRSLLGKSSPSV
ncbi:hypothetical protein B9Z19DRAFT_414857 [Tuber borchii]|uniref:Uncharacterized protein n=1 Tax=Tuber borchii TaxID=42251 RepID=A0A2T6ZGU9_TUBBO|nr:hypothetical protein B9Z19DRAFT_414857 [Tuber borchii]